MWRIKKSSFSIGRLDGLISNKSKQKGPVSTKLWLVVAILTLGSFSALAQDDATPFITTWRTTSANETITFPSHSAVSGASTNSATIDWGDGTVINDFIGELPQHTYAVAGTYTVSIIGDGTFQTNPILPKQIWGDFFMTRISTTERKKLMSIEAWGNVRVGRAESMFNGATNMVMNAVDAPIGLFADVSFMFANTTFETANMANWDMSGVNNMTQMFAFNRNFNADIGAWNVSNVTDMEAVFSGANAFNQDISGWNVGKVTIMTRMFLGATAFNQSLNGWNVSKVRGMESMFEEAKAFNGAIDQWNVGIVTTMEKMFFAANAFNQDISGWNVGSVTTLEAMFATEEVNAREGEMSFTQSLSNWDVNQVRILTDMFNNNTAFNGPMENWNLTTSGHNLSGMFQDATAFNQDISSWNVTGVHTMNAMFQNASSFNQDITGWDVGNLTDMRSMFRGTAIFNQDISGWDVSSVGSLGEMFRDNKVFNLPLNGWVLTSAINMELVFSNSIYNADISGWNMSNVQNISNMFQDNKVFNQDISGWVTSNVTRMSGLFNGATVFNQDISGWNTLKVLGMNSMFAEATAFNQDITGWMTGSVTDMGSIFQGNTSFNQDISGWDVSKVTNLIKAFNGTTAFTPDLNTWNVSKVTNMSFMFRNTNYNGNITSWQTDALTNTNSMFRDNPAFDQDISGWNMSKVTDLESMFQNATAFNQNINAWIVSGSRDFFAMFQGATSFNQDISSWNVTSATSTTNGTLTSMFQGASSFDQNLGAWDLSQTRNMTSIFDGTGLSLTNYDAMLIAWSAQTLQNNVVFGALNTGFCSAEVQRQSIIDTYGWSITDRGRQCGPFMTSLVVNNNTQLTVTFSDNLTTNEGNPGDFTLVDALDNAFAVTAQMDGTAGDGNIVLTVADLSTAIGDLKLTYTNNNNQLFNDSNESVETDAVGLPIDFDQAAPTMVSAARDGNGIVLTLSEEVQVVSLSGSAFILTDNNATTFNVTSATDGTAMDKALLLVADISAAVGTVTLTYVNTNNGVRDFGANFMATNATGVVVGSDETNPTMSSSSPADGATSIATATNITLTFSENIVFGTGSIQVVDLTNGTNSFAIDAALPGMQASISGAVLTINPSSNLDDNSSYSVQINATAIDDASGNSFAGITDNTTLDFNTADETSPILTSSSPADGATGVSSSSNLVLTFDENITFGTGNIQVIDVTDNSNSFTINAAAPGTEASITGAVLTIDLSSGLDGSSNYAIQIAATAIDDTSGNSYVGITDNTTLDFNTENVLPVANIDASSTLEDVNLTFNVTTNDTDTGGTIDVSTVDLDPTTTGIQTTITTSGGTFSVINTGVVSLMPATNFNGAASVNYTVNDNEGATSNSVTYTVTVTAVNDAPTFVSAGVTSVDDGSAYSYTIETNDVDLQKPTVTATTIPSWLTLETVTTVSTVAGTGDSGNVDGSGTSASFNKPEGVAVDASGNIYVADKDNHKIRKITPAGVVSTFAGTGSLGDTDGPGTSASFNGPTGVAVDASGNVYVADQANHKIRKITPAGVVSTFAGGEVQGNLNGTGTSAQFKFPTGIAIDATDNLYVADRANNRIRKITPAGVVSTFAGSGRGSADGTGTSASFFFPSGVAVDASGNVYVADGVNHLIRKITAAGIVSTMAGSGTAGSTDGTGTLASFEFPSDVAVDALGNVFVAGANNNRIRKISPAGVVSTIAGSGSSGSLDGIGTLATFENLRGIGVDALGNIYVTDTNNHSIRKIVTGPSLTGTPSSTDVGPHNVVLQANDGSGGTVQQSFVITVKDVTAPASPVITSLSEDAGSNASDKITNDQTLTFAGTAEANSTVTVFADGSNRGSTVANGTGEWSFDSSIGEGGLTFTEGTHTITATATDAAGNISAASADFSITIDLTAPVGPSVLTISEDTGTSGDDELTNDTGLIFTGTTEANATVTVFIDGSNRGQTTTNGSGEWSFDSSVGEAGLVFTEGAHSVTALATDVAGNIGTQGTALSLTIDLTAPVAPVVSAISSDNGVDGADEITNDQTLTFVGTAEANSTIEVFIGGTSIGTTSVNGSGAWSFDHTATTLTDAVYAVTAKATDAAGNTGTESSALSVTIDATAPLPGVVFAINVDSNNSDDLITNDNTLLFGGIAINEGELAEFEDRALFEDDTYEFFLDGTSIGSVGSTIMGTTGSEGISFILDHTGTMLADGSYILTVATTDLAGNTTAALSEVTRTLVVDTQAPGVPTIDLDASSDLGISATDDITYYNTTDKLNLSGTAEANSIVELTFVYDGITSSGNTATADDSGNWTFEAGTVVAGFIQTGSTENLLIRAMATDAAGNQGTEGTLTVVVDQGLAVSTLSPADDEMDVLPNANLVVTFDKNVLKGTGNIIIKEKGSDRVQETIDVTGSNVTINGAVVTINPVNNILPPDTDFYINIDAGAFKNEAGAPFAGITDDVTWGFTIIAASVVSSVDVPANDTYVIGEELDFTVNMILPVTITGTATIPITIGTTIVNASQVGTVSNASAIVFRYTVLENELDTDGVAVGSAMNLNGGTMRDEFDVDAILTLNNIATTTSVFVDAVAPLPGVVFGVNVDSNNSDDLITNDNTLLFGGIAINEGELAEFEDRDLFENDTYEFFLDGTSIGSIGSNIMGPTGSEGISFILDHTGTVLADGSYAMSIVSTDPAGNTTTGTGELVRTLVVDTQAPGVPTIDLDASSDLGISATDDITYYNTTDKLNLSGTAEANSIVELTFIYNGISSSGNTVTADGSGNWAFEAGAVVAGFIQTGSTENLVIRAIATDTAGNQGTEGTLTVVVDQGLAVSTLSPADDEMDVLPNANLVVTFDKDIVLGTGNIIIKEKGNDRVQETIDVTGSNVTINGAVVTINPVNNILPPDTDFYINIDAGAFKNEAGAPFVGITDDVTWSFTIIAASVVSSVDVPSAATYNIGDNLDFTANMILPVSITGTATIPVTIGSTTVNATQVGTVSNSTTILFRYTVVEDELDADGIAVGSAMSLNGGTMRDEFDVNAILTLNNVGVTTAVLVDGVKPTPIISSTAVDLVKGAFSGTITFDEVVENFVIGDLNVVNGTASNLVNTTAGTTWTVDITPTADGMVSLSLPANTANDVAGNDSNVSNTISRAFDGTAPTVISVNRKDSDPLNTADAAADFRVIFSESVTGVDPIDLEVILTGSATGVLNTIVAIDATTYDVNINGIGGEGTIGLNVKDDDTVIDTATNPLAAAFTGQVYTTNFAPTDIGLSTMSIDENNALMATVASLVTTDADGSDSHTYSLVTGAGDADNAAFAISGTNLNTSNISFNFEADASYEIRLKTDDGKGGVFEKAVTITINDVNEVPISLSLTNASIDEADEALDVGILMSLDQDGGETFTYSLTSGTGDADNAEFAIAGTTLRTAGLINFEDGPTRSVLIRVTDSGGLTFDQQFTINIGEIVVEPLREFTTNTSTSTVKNVFSPNGDGINETWVIEDLQDNPINTVKVYAQGGKLIFSQDNYQNDWDGTFKGDPIPPGTYYFEINVYNGESIVRGFLTIIRNR